MKFIELKKSLEQPPKPIYFLQGEDRLLLQKAQDIIINKFVLEYKDLNLQIFSEDTFTMQNLVESAQTFPFGNEYRVLLVKTQIGVLNEKDQALFESFASNPTPHSIVIFVFNEQDGFYKKNYSKVTYVDCNKLSRVFLTKYVATLLSKLGKSITTDAVDLFLQFCDYDLSKIENECKKLASIVEDNTIANQDILANVPKSVDYQIFELNEAVCEKNSAKAMNILNFLLDKKVSTQYILGVIIANMRRLFYSSITDDSDSNIAKQLNVKEYAITLAKKNGKKFKKITLKNNIEKCLETDCKIKSGLMNDETAIQLLIFELLN